MFVSCCTQVADLHWLSIGQHPNWLTSRNLCHSPAQYFENFLGVFGFLRVVVWLLRTGVCLCCTFTQCVCSLFGCSCVEQRGSWADGAGGTGEGSFSDTPVPFAVHSVVPCARLEGISSQFSSHLSTEQQHFCRGIRQGRCAETTISLEGC